MELDRIAANVRFLKAHGHLRYKERGPDGPYDARPLDIGEKFIEGPEDL